MSHCDGFTEQSGADWCRLRRHAQVRKGLERMRVRFPDVRHSLAQEAFYTDDNSVWIDTVPLPQQPKRTIGIRAGRFVFTSS